MNIPEIIKNKKAKSMSSSIKDAPSQLKIVSVHDAKSVLDQATISLFSSEPIDELSTITRLQNQTFHTT